MYVHIKLNDMHARMHACRPALLGRWVSQYGLEFVDTLMIYINVDDDNNDLYTVRGSQIVFV